MKKLGDTLEYAQYGLSMPAAAHGTYPMFRMNNFDEGKVIANDLVYVELPDNQVSKFLLQPGDILFNRTNSAALVGKTGIFLLSGKFVFASYLVRLRVDASIAYPQYINYVLNEPSVKQLLARLATPGVSQCNINPTTLQNKVVVPLPPLAEQKKIVEMLSVWDEAIGLQKRQLQQLRRRKKELAFRLLNKQQQLLGFTEGWESHPLGKYFSRLTTRNAIGNTNVLTISAQQGLVGQMRYFNKNIASAEVSNYYLLSRGDFAYNKSYSAGYPMGVIKPLIQYEQGIVSPLYICLRPTTDDGDFFEHYFEAGMMNRGISQIAQEGARNHGLLNVSAKDFMELDTLIPPADERRAIADVLNTADAEIRLHERKLAALREQKRGLLQQLLTGEILLA